MTLSPVFFLSKHVDLLKLIIVSIDSTTMILNLGTMSGDNSDCHHLGGTTGIWWVEVRDAEASSPQQRITWSNMSVGLWLRNLALPQLGFRPNLSRRGEIPEVNLQSRTNDEPDCCRTGYSFSCSRYLLIIRFYSLLYSARLGMQKGIRQVYPLREFRDF